MKVNAHGLHSYIISGQTDSIPFSQPFSVYQLPNETKVGIISLGSNLKLAHSPSDMPGALSNVADFS